jgi:hypothetical protein
MPPCFKSKQASDVQTLANFVRAGISWKTIGIYLQYIKKMVEKLGAVRDRARAEGILSKIEAYRDLHLANPSHVKADLSAEIEKLAQLFEDVSQGPPEVSG